jgi:hypothetical protein
MSQPRHGDDGGLMTTTAPATADTTAADRTLAPTATGAADLAALGSPVA